MPFFIADADVLIDYVGADLSMLSAVSRRVGPVHVTGVVLNEVEGLDAASCSEYDLVVVDAPTPMLVEAAARGGSLSLADRVCLMLAEERGWTCVSNDRRLRSACEHAGVATRWGLELMLDLLAVEKALCDDAIAAARVIRENNRRHITAEILGEFERKARAATRGARR